MKFWTNERQAMLAELYPIVSNRELGLLFGVSQRAIEEQAKTQPLKRTREEQAKLSLINRERRYRVEDFIPEIVRRSQYNNPYLGIKDQVGIVLNQIKNKSI